MERITKKTLLCHQADPQGSWYVPIVLRLPLRNLGYWGRWIKRKVTHQAVTQTGFQESLELSCLNLCCTGASLRAFRSCSEVAEGKLRPFGWSAPTWLTHSRVTVYSTHIFLWLTSQLSYWRSYWKSKCLTPEPAPSSAWKPEGRGFITKSYGNVDQKNAQCAQDQFFKVVSLFKLLWDTKKQNFKLKKKEYNPIPHFTKNRNQSFSQGHMH